MKNLILILTTIIFFGCKSSVDSDSKQLEQFVLKNKNSIKAAPKRAPKVLSECKPIVTVYPKYPNAQVKNLQEGWVHVEITVGKEGKSPSKVKILDSSPVKVFDQEAIRAVEMWYFAMSKTKEISTCDKVLEFSLIDS